MIKNRKTITFDHDILELSKALEPEERKEFFLQLVEHFLEDKQFPDTVSPCLKVALAAASPTIRKLQSKFQNGKCTKATSCPKNESESKPIEANPPAHMYNNQSLLNNKVSSSINFNTYQPSNVINNNINLYKNISTLIIYVKNNKVLSNEQSSILLNNEQQVAEALKNLYDKNHQAFINFYSTFENAIKNDSLKIAGSIRTRNQIVSAMLKLLLSPAGVQSISDLSNELESTPGIRYKISYFTTMLWNREAAPIPGTQYKKSNQPNFKQRTYTKEELDALYDDLDDVEI